VTGWTWNFGDGSTLQGSNPAIHKNPEHTYTTPGTYTVSLTVTNGVNSLNASYSNYITIHDRGMIGENFAEGFEGQWPNQNFSIDNQLGDLTFEVTPTAFFSGSKSLKLRNHGNNISGNIDALYTATFDLNNAANAQLSYKWAYTGKTTITNDQLIISFSGDCGETWQVRRMREAQSNLMTAAPINSQFTPASTDQWNNESLSIATQSLSIATPGWLTDGFQARFEFVGKGGNNFYLDDMVITSIWMTSI